jgi:hypothetical protein
MQCLPLHSGAMNQNKKKQDDLNGYFLQFDEHASASIVHFLLKNLKNSEFRS